VLTELFSKVLNSSQEGHVAALRAIEDDLTKSKLERGWSETK
jgi:hypothetical protein